MFTIIVGRYRDSGQKGEGRFAKAIEKLGAKSVSHLGEILGGEPLISREKKDFVKQPTQKSVQI